MSQPILSHEPLPDPSQRTPRMTPELRAIQPGQSYIFDDKKAAVCLYQWLTYHGMKAVRKTEGGKIRVGRVA
jgi:hypothetical protein